MTTRWSVECWHCGGSGEIEGGCTCMDDTCCCADPEPPTCDVCMGTGSILVTKLTDDNCETAVPLD